MHACSTHRQPKRYTVWWGPDPSQVRFAVLRSFSAHLAGCVFWLGLLNCSHLLAQQSEDYLRELQFRAVDSQQANWMHWGDRVGKFSNWTNHSNRLIPVYSFGLTLESVKGPHSVYRDADAIRHLYGCLPDETLNPQAEYFDQTDIYRLQKQALDGKKQNIILMIFDGMDWQTTQAAAIYKNHRIVYTKGRGTGLSFLDYAGATSDFGFCVTAPGYCNVQEDVDTQSVTDQGGPHHTGGYAPDFGGATPWSPPGDPSYLVGKRRNLHHRVTDSAASATSMTSGIKTYNAAIGVTSTGQQVETIAHEAQRIGKAIGIVTNVPISHATPGSAYAHNVSRNDYQDIARDLLGLKSVSHPDQPLPGVDVLLGGGWGEMKADDRSKQGRNYVPGNCYLTDQDLAQVNFDNGGRYIVAQRTAGKPGADVLRQGVHQAIDRRARLLGFFGAQNGHLPFQTADGKFDPTRGVTRTDHYAPEEILENPTLADLTAAALEVLDQRESGFWLMVEAGDVDWANHNNNLDDAIGAVLSGEAAFDVITNWVEKHSSWDETVLIVTSDHGHMLNIDNLDVLTGRPIELDSKSSAGESGPQDFGK